MSRTRSRPWPWLALVLLLHVLTDLAWLSADRQIPDGDEDGHLGAIELYRAVADDQGMLESIRQAFTSPSDYPPLFALANALPLAALKVPPPFPNGVGPLQVLWSTLTVAAVAGLAYVSSLHLGARAPDTSRPWPVGTEEGDVVSRPDGKISSSIDPGPDARAVNAAGWVAVLAAAAYATFPLSTALGREAMPEPFLTLWVTLTLWAALASRGFTRTGPMLLFGLAMAAGGLTKQTFVLYVAGPLALLAIPALLRRAGPALSRLAMAAVIAVPLPLLWVWQHREAQQAYALQSAAARADVGWLLQAIYYPVELAGDGVGLFWIGPLILASVLLIRRRAAWPVLALLAVLVTLVVMPKKYPRLIVPALPLVATVLALGLAELKNRALRRGLELATLSAGVLQQAAISFSTPLPPRLGLWQPELMTQVDPGCLQEWIRRPSRDDLGFESVLKAARAVGASAGTPVAFVKEPDIPCSYETTFNYTYLLAEYGRRHGLELGEIPVARNEQPPFLETAARARLVVSTEPWCEPDPAPAGAQVGQPPSSPPVAAEQDPAPAGAQVGQPPSSPTVPAAPTRPPPSPAPTDPTCALRPDFALEGQFPARSDRLAFTLYFYRRVAAR